ncbi:hypothetical protein [Sphingobium estronivorans]|uniref:hypothetical protein n=1 Tax=Sphingobium estronivorans TaxID=1577690 RepID=UPI0013C3683B|nr:hypothetical protein [Sphingobium estronivorans]
MRFPLFLTDALAPERRSFIGQLQRNYSIWSTSDYSAHAPNRSFCATDFHNNTRRRPSNESYVSLSTIDPLPVAQAMTRRFCGEHLSVRQWALGCLERLLANVERGESAGFGPDQSSLQRLD